MLCRSRGGRPEVRNGCSGPLSSLIRYEVPGHAR